MHRFALALLATLALSACDGYVATKGVLVSTGARQPTECYARIEDPSGTVVSDWFSIDTTFDEGAVVAPGRYRLLMLISCSGHFPVARELHSGPSATDLGRIILTPTP